MAERMLNTMSEDMSERMVKDMLEDMSDKTKNFAIANAAKLMLCQFDVAHCSKYLSLNFCCAHHHDSGTQYVQ